MYLRFVTVRVHKDSPEPAGVFAAAYALLDSGDLTRDEWKVLREMLNWFNANLKSPPKTFDGRRAIFWFKCSNPVQRTTFARSGTWSSCYGSMGIT
jgi:hypothetical protein